MASLDILIDGKLTEKKTIDADRTVIGRRMPANVILSRPTVSSSHAQIIRTAGAYAIEDLGSVNKTFVNGKPLRAKTAVPLQEGDLVQIADFNLIFHAGVDGKSATAGAAKTPSGRGTKEPYDANQYFKLKRGIHEVLIERMNLKKLTLKEFDDQALRKKTEENLDKIILEMGTGIPPDVDRAVLKKELIDDALGLGAIEDLLDDDNITEIMVNGKDHVYVERGGKLHLSDKKFYDDGQVMSVIQRIVAPLGRAINESAPVVDARLSDGSRVNAIIPPLALKGPTLTIRKFSKRRLTTDDLIRFGSINEKMVAFLKLAVHYRKNIVISGGTGSGKTTLLNMLSAFIPSDERIITVEDAAELSLPQEHVVSLETRPPNMEGKGAIAIRDLVINCLRMRPDRIVVGECRGREALDMLQAMNTGHDGSLTTVHANTPRDVISRLETMVLMAGMELPVKAIRQQISSAINLIVQQSRMPDGSRKITHITEVTGMEGDTISLQDIFLFSQKGFDKAGKVLGEYKATGVIPNFMFDLKKRGIEADLSLFETKKGTD
jgi:pilus assembly protein CpaF